MRIHNEIEKNEICALPRNSKKLMVYFESLDKANMYIEGDITYPMKSLLIEWIISCHEKLNLTDDVLHLGIYIIGKFLSRRKFSTLKLQLIGIASLLIAAKCEEVQCPALNSFSSFLCGTYNNEDIKRAEKYILFSLDYNLEYVNPLIFLRRCSKANNYDPWTRKMGKYFLELTYFYQEFDIYSGNVKATASIYLARKICQTDTNRNLFFKYSHLTEEEIRPCVNSLVNIFNEERELYECLERKYARSTMYSVNILASKYIKKNFIKKEGL